MSSVSLVRPLFDGPLDVVGDVHGEMNALLELLGCLGYREDGTHPEGRRLVFVGDLVDRGPDNVAVVNFVQRLVEADPPRAQIVLGNHELNLLLGRRLEVNGWFFREEEHLQRRMQEFFGSMPLALVRPDLRVVHACWHAKMIDLARQADDVIDLYHHHARRIMDENNGDSPLDEVEGRLNLHNRNPVRLVTLGPERRAVTPFVKGGKLLYEERVEWWTEYADPVWCVFGHYAIPADQPHVFGPAICADFGGGYRALERSTPGFNGNYKTRLAAIRFPEQVIVFDDGTEVSMETFTDTSTPRS